MKHVAKRPAAPALRKGAATRHRVIQQTAPVFNTKGLSGSALSDLMEATGLQKGGLYRHFASKEELALEALNYSLELVEQARFGDLDPTAPGVDQLQTFARNFIERPSPLPGGCPILNTSVEHDDGNPSLRQAAQKAVLRWLSRLADIVRAGQSKGEIRRSVPPAELATMLLAALEGAVAISRLAPHAGARDAVGRQLAQWLEGFRTGRASPVPA